MRRQRIYGLLLVLAAVLLPVLDGGDATASLVLGGLGGWMLGSRRYLLYGPRTPVYERVRPSHRHVSLRAQKKSASAVGAADAPDTHRGAKEYYAASMITQRGRNVK